MSKERYQICKNCEWYLNTDGRRWGVCCYNPPNDIGGNDPVEPGHVFDESHPRTDEASFCSKWTPKDYLNNPAIKESWDHFVTIHVIAMEHV